MGMIKYAMRMELDGHTFYKKAADKAADQGLEEVLLYLAEEDGGREVYRDDAKSQEYAIAKALERQEAERRGKWASVDQHRVQEQDEDDEKRHGSQPHEQQRGTQPSQDRQRDRVDDENHQAGRPRHQKSEYR